MNRIYSAHISLLYLLKNRIQLLSVFVKKWQKTESQINIKKMSLVKKKCLFCCAAVQVFCSAAVFALLAYGAYFS